MSVTAPYHLEIRENGRVLARRELEDPFHTTTITVRERWRMAWQLLRHGLTYVVSVHATPERIANVMRITPEDDARVRAERSQPSVEMTADGCTEEAGDA